MAAMLALALLGAAQDEGLKVGDAVPAFEGLDDQGKVWKSSERLGKKVTVVFFYPAAFTGGWTKQACGFRDELKPLTDLGAEVIGVSGDSAATQALFKKEHNLPYTLLGDETGAVAKAFGVPVKAGGKVKHKDQELVRGVTAARWTFVIGKDGKVAYKNTKVNAAEDAKAVLAAVEKLK